jgi:hypothetical protein
MGDKPMLGNIERVFGHEMCHVWQTIGQRFSGLLGEIEWTDVEAFRRLGVPGHKVGDSRLVGGRPPSAVCRRRVL